MGTAILRSQNCLTDRLCRETLTPPLKSRSNPNPKPNSVFGDSRRRKRSPVGFQSIGLQSQSQSMVAKVPTKNLVMGQVKILKRGETLIPAAKKDNHNHRDNRKPRVKIVEDLDMVLGSTDRLGPDSEIVQKQIRLNKGDGVYAGSGFFASPPPSSLPVPGFLVRKGKGTAAAAYTEALNFIGMEETELRW